MLRDNRAAGGAAERPRRYTASSPPWWPAGWQAAQRRCERVGSSHVPLVWRQFTTARCLLSLSVWTLPMETQLSRSNGDEETSFSDPVLHVDGLLPRLAYCHTWSRRWNFPLGQRQIYRGERTRDHDPEQNWVCPKRGGFGLDQTEPRFKFLLTVWTFHLLTGR